MQVNELLEMASLERVSRENMCCSVALGPPRLGGRGSERYKTWSERPLFAKPLTITSSTHLVEQALFLQNRKPPGKKRD